MKYILLFWALPMGLFWGWYYLSYNDMHFGYLMLSRLLHDHVFEIYGNILGVDPATLPPLIIRASIVDTGLIFAIFAFRRRKQIREWVRRRREGRPVAIHEAGQERPAG
ncbi:DUF6105 family protein [Aliihoeflea sp. PC F10.4]